jgi:hypothetical protein
MLKTLLPILLFFAALPLDARDFVLDTARGRVIFDAQTDRVVVGWRNGSNLEQQAERLTGMKDVAHPPLDRVIPQGAATVIRLSRFLSDDQADELAENLLVSSSVSWISPLLSLNGESYVASGEIRFRAEIGGLSAAEIQQFELTELRTLADGTTIATRSRGSAWDVLLLCNLLTELTSVEWCEPMWLEGIALNEAAPIDTPMVTIRRAGEDILLSWQWCGDARYEIWSTTGAAEPFLEAVVEETQFADMGVLSRQAYKLYSVRAVRRER